VDERSASSLINGLLGPVALPSKKTVRIKGVRVMATIGVVSSALSDHEHQVQLRRAVIASTIGTAIEWYDFFLYSIVTGLVFAKLFFPNSDPLVGTLEAFGMSACRPQDSPAQIL
jgi:hypothetical protein